MAALVADDVPFEEEFLEAPDMTELVLLKRGGAAGSGALRLRNSGMMALRK